MLLITEVLISQTGTHTLGFRTSMHKRVRHWQSLPRVMLPEPESILNTHKFPVPVEHPMAEGHAGRFVKTQAQCQEKMFHFSTLAGASPSLENFGCSTSWIPPAQAWPHIQLLRHGFGKRQQWCPGGDAPKGRAGGCLCTSLAGSQEERAGLKIIQSTIKTHLSRQTHLHGKRQRKTPPSAPWFGGESVRWSG